DVEVDLLGRPRLQLVLQLLHLRALPADDDARPGGRDRDPRPVGRALDVDLGDARVVELVLDVAPDLHVLVQQARVALRREPAGAPGPRRAEAEADRMRLLAHLYLFSLDLGRLDFPAPLAAAVVLGRAAARSFVAADAPEAAGAPAGPACRAAGALSRGGGTGRAAPLVSSLTPIVRGLDRCRMKKARAIARGCTRFIEGRPSATAWTTRRSSRLRTWWLCSALAIADRRTFSTIRAAVLCGRARSLLRDALPGASRFGPPPRAARRSLRWGLERCSPGFRPPSPLRRRTFRRPWLQTAPGLTHTPR